MKINKLTLDQYKRIGVNVDNFGMADKLVMLHHINKKFSLNINFDNANFVSKLTDVIECGDSITFAHRKIMPILNPRCVPSNSMRTEYYWINRGYSEEYARNKVSQIQKEASKRSEEYWLKRGYSEDEAESLVSKHQKQNCAKLAEKYSNNERRAMSPMFLDYWMKRGLSKDEARQKINEKNPTTVDYWLKHGYSEDTAITKHLEYNPSCREYYIARGMTDENEIRTSIRSLNKKCVEYWKLRTPEAYKENLISQYSSWYYKISPWHREIVEFIISECYNNKTDNLRYFDNEYAFFVESLETVCLTDFVDEKNKIAIEFHGDYFHRQEHMRIKDAAKQEQLENDGFAYMEVWESKWGSSKEEVKQSIKEFINENQKH